MSTIKKVNVNGQEYDLAGSGGGGVLIEITHSELVALRDSGGLVQGNKYRITDYNAVFKTLRSAGNQFDIVVEALSSSELSEKASAMIHEGDVYFKNCHLDLWTVYYSLDNDTSRFKEASASGKGFIWRLIDEYNNDVCFDFKNALFTMSGSDFPFITSSNGSLDFYLFSYNTGTGFASQSDIIDLSTTNPSNVSNNFVSFDLKTNFYVVLGADKSALEIIGTRAKILNNKVLNNKVRLISSSTGLGFKYCDFTGTIDSKCLLSASKTSFDQMIIENVGSSSSSSIYESRIKGANKIIVNGSQFYDNNVSCNEISQELHTLIDIKGCVIRIDNGTSSNLPCVLSEETLGVNKVVNKLIWAKIESSIFKYKVIDPFNIP
nr:MAG TPA: hypothetical protein [Caudoviricetes sp.]